MEYLIIGVIALIVFVALLIIIKVEQVRNRAKALFLQAEKYVTEDKLEYVCTNLYNFLSSTTIGNIITFFLKEEAFKEIIQKLYDNTRKMAFDLLDDGEFNKSNKEE
jgi:hypothetical protein